MRIGARWKLTAILVAASLQPSAALAAERVDDGNFESRTVCGAECENTAWSRTGERVTFCDTVTCPNPPRAPGEHWVRFGGGTAYTEEGDPPFWARGTLEQRVEIPAGPALLDFAVRRLGGVGQGQLTARMDGVPVFAIQGPFPDPEFLPEEIDVSAFAGPGRHDLRFEFACMGLCNSILLDDVSLEAPDPTSPPRPPAPPPPPDCRGRLATIFGSSGVQTGTAGADVIVGSAKADTIRAKGGDDLVCAGKGADRVSGGPGIDVLLGQAGADRLDGGPGADALVGGPGADRER